MAGDSLTSTSAAPPSEIAAYLRALEAGLPPAPRRVRRAILDEIGDGLLAAVQRHTAPATLPDEALRTAITEFGSPQVVARAFAGELAIARSRRLLATLLLTGPVVGAWWLLLLAPRPWPVHPAELMAAIPVLPGVGAVVVLAVAVLGVTGRAARLLPVLSPRGALRAARGAATACVVFDLVLLGQLVVLAAGVPAAHPPALMAAAAVASLARLPWMAYAARACSRSVATVD